MRIAKHVAFRITTPNEGIAFTIGERTRIAEQAMTLTPLPYETLSAMLGSLAHSIGRLQGVLDYIGESEGTSAHEELEAARIAWEAVRNAMTVKPVLR
jgi:hypothetical protein